MQRKHIVMIVVGGIAAFLSLIGLIAYFVFQATAPLTQAGDDFFAASRKGDYEAAYALTSKQLQSVNSVDQLRGFIQQYHLDKVEDTSWGSRSFENSQGRLSGTVTTQDGATIPIDIQLVWEGEAWKISAIDVNTPGLNAQRGPVSVPSETTQLAMVGKATEGFMTALGEKDFSSFLADWARNSIRLEKLESSFGKIRAHRGELASAVQGAPIIEDARVTDKNLLNVVGHYDGDGLVYKFDYDFIPEGKGWKLMRFNFDVVHR